MKAILTTVGLGLLLLRGGLAVGLAQGTLFTYQGRLTDNNAPAQTDYDFRFTLCDENGTPVPGASSPEGTLNVKNGLFKANLDFGPGQFTGLKRLLQVEIKPKGDPAADYQKMLPLQELTPSPYAIHAGTAANLVAGANPNFTGTPTFNPSGGGAPFAVGNTTKVPNLNADLLDGKDSSAFVLKAGDGMTGTLYLNTPGDGLIANTTGAGLNAALRGQSSGVNGNGVVGEANNGTSAYGIWGKSSSGFAGAFDGKVRINGAAMVTYPGLALDVTSTSGEDPAVQGQGNGFNGTGVLGVANDGPGAYGVWGMSTAGYAGMFDGSVQVRANGTVDRPQLRLLEQQTDDYARLEFQSAGKAKWHVAVGGAPNEMNFYNTANGNVMQLKESGQLYVRCLTILGGCDLAEPFEMSQPDIPCGAVVAIDEEHPGQLKLSDRAYDTRVAGVVSGANGIHAGVTLRQESVLEHGQNVALTGRVYALADASSNPIKPGDLLTTSTVRGHVMKAADHERAQGAVVGKAMSGLESGRGHVLVLVNLQ